MSVFKVQQGLHVRQNGAVFDRLAFVGLSGQHGSVVKAMAYLGCVSRCELSNAFFERRVMSVDFPVMSWEMDPDDEDKNSRTSPLVHKGDCEMMGYCHSYTDGSSL